MLAYCAANYARTHLVKYNETALHFMFAILSLTQSYVKKKKKAWPKLEDKPAQENSTRFV